MILYKKMNYYSNIKIPQEYHSRHSQEEEIVSFWKQLKELPSRERITVEEELSKKLVSSIHCSRDSF